MTIQRGSPQREEQSAGLDLSGAGVVAAEAGSVRLRRAGRFGASGLHYLGEAETHN